VVGVAIFLTFIGHAQAVTFEADQWDLGAVAVGQTATIKLKVTNSSPYQLEVRYLDIDPPFMFYDNQQQKSRTSPFSLDRLIGWKEFEVNFTPTEVGRFCGMVTISYKKCPLDDACLRKKYWQKAGPICATAVSGTLLSSVILEPLWD
jgi:hypothetical protein